MQTRVKITTESVILHQGQTLDVKELILEKKPTLLYLIESIDDNIFLRLNKIIALGIRVIVITCNYQNMVNQKNVYYIVTNNHIQAEAIELYGVGMISYCGTWGNNLVGELVTRDIKLRVIYDILDIDPTLIKDASLNDNKAIGIISLNGIGDNIMLTSTLNAYYEKGYVVDIAVPNSEVFKHFTNVRNIYNDPNKIERQNYEKVYDITYILSSYKLAVNQQHRIYAIAESCGLKKEELKNFLPTLNLSKEEDIRGKELLRFEQSTKKKIGICFEACDAGRTYPESRQVELIEDIVNSIEADIFILGTDIRGKKCDGVIDLRGQTNIRELFGVIKNLDVLISVDTGILHIGGAFEKDIVFLSNLLPGVWRTYDNTTILNKFGTIREIVSETKNKINQKIDKDIKRNQKPNRILLCRWDAGMGDILMVTAALKSIKAKYPTHELVFGCVKEYKELLDGNPYVDRIITEEALIKKEDYKIIYNLTQFFEHSHYPMDKYPANGRSRIDLMYEDCLKIPAVDRRPLYYISDEEKTWAKNWLKQKKRCKYLVGFHIDSNAVARNYPIDYFLKVVEVLLQQDVQVVLLGPTVGKQSLAPYGELKVAGLINATGLSIRETAAIVNEVDLMVAIDSGLLHLSAAIGKKTIALFGTIAPMNRLLYYENVDELFPAGEQDCIPCNDALYIKKCMDVCSDLCWRRQPTLCMWRLTPQKVYTKILLDLGIWKLKSEYDRPKLSFAMMTYNEEKWIEKCLAGIYDIADEIVVVDNSTDKTREILKRYPKVKVYDVKELPCPKECTYCKDEGVDIKSIGRPCSAKLRQQSFDECTGDWIFRIDADEIITKEQAHKLRMLVDYTDTLFPGVKVFWFPMTNFYLDDSHYKVGNQGHQWFPDSHKRLHKNEMRFHKWVLPAHERMVDYNDIGELRYLDDKKSFPFQYTSNWLMIYHYGYLQPRKTRQEDAQKYKKMKVLLHTLDSVQVEEWFLSKPIIKLPEGWGTGKCEYEKGEKG